MNRFGGVILAGGRGERMKSPLQKVLLKVGDKPMLLRVVDAMKRSGLDTIVVVLGTQTSEAKRILPAGVETAIQERPRGTADAVRVAEEHMEKSITGMVVACADVPFIRPASIRRLVELHVHSGAVCTLLTGIVNDPHGYGRIVRDAGGQVVAVIEEKELSAEDRLLNEINSGCCVFERAALVKQLRVLKPHKPKEEYYLTDVVNGFAREGQKVSALSVGDASEITGVNTAQDLELANKRGDTI